MKKLFASFLVGFVLISFSFTSQAAVLTTNVLKFQIVGDFMKITYLPDYTPKESNTVTSILFYGERARFAKKYSTTLYVAGVPDDLKIVDKITGIVTPLVANASVNVSRNQAISMAADLTVGFIYDTRTSSAGGDYLVVLSRTASAASVVRYENNRLYYGNYSARIQHYIGNGF